MVAVKKSINNFIPYKIGYFFLLNFLNLSGSSFKPASRLSAGMAN